MKCWVYNVRSIFIKASRAAGAAFTGGGPHGATPVLSRLNDTSGHTQNESQSVDTSRVTL